MYKFSNNSRKNLSTCDIRLQEIFEEVIKHIDCSVICGYRNEYDQNSVYSLGNSKLKFPDSKHNVGPSKAIDVIPYPVDWSNVNKFYYFAGVVKGVASVLGYKIRWGGDWDSDNEFKDNKFNDLPHFEI